MLDRRDPEYRIVRDERALLFHIEFSNGRMSPDVYRAWLMTLGFRGREIAECERENWPVMGPPGIPRFG